MLTWQISIQVPLYNGFQSLESFGETELDFYFCGTRSDLEEVLADVESQLKLRYFLRDYYLKLPIPWLGSLINDDLGISTQKPRTYYVLPHTVEIGTSFVGGNNQKYKIDHGKNGKAVLLTPSGVFTEGLMVQGQLASASMDPDSVALQNVFKKSFKRRFHCVTSVYLGKEAEELFERGWNVAPAYNSKPDAYLRKRANEQPYTEQLELRTGERLSYTDSCRLLIQQGALGSANLVANGWDGVNELPRPAGIPHPSKLSDGLNFFREFIGGADPEDEELVLEHLTLPCTFINRSELNSVSFRNTDLSESFICWNDLANVDFTNSDLHDSDMRANSFENVRFDGSDLSNADLRRSTFEKCTFAEANMKACKLHLAWVQLLELSPKQRREIEWCNEDGPEPPGG